MNTGGETTSILMAFSAEMGKEALKNSVELMKFLIMGYLRNKGNLNTGEVNMKRMIESGEELKTMDLNVKDAERFAVMAKESGITFAFFQKNEEKHTIAYLAREAELVNKLLDIIKQGKVKEMDEVENLINEYKVGADRSFIVDKDNPENYIQVDTKEIQRTYLVDMSNPYNNIKITEDLKNHDIKAEINFDNHKEYWNGKESVREGVVSLSKEFKNPDLVNSEDEIEKLKEVYDKSDRKKTKETHYKTDYKKTMEEVDKHIKEVREKVPKTEQKKQKEKHNERGEK